MFRPQTPSGLFSYGCFSYSFQKSLSKCFHLELWLILQGLFGNSRWYADINQVVFSTSPWPCVFEGSSNFGLFRFLSNPVVLINRSILQKKVHTNTINIVSFLALRLYPPFHSSCYLSKQQLQVRHSYEPNGGAGPPPEGRGEVAAGAVGVGGEVGSERLPMEFGTLDRRVAAVANA